ncbi:MAG: S-layer homology domain-containing protein [Armatimonadota bacterium]
MVTAGRFVASHGGRHPSAVPLTRSRAKHRRLLAVALAALFVALLASAAGAQVSTIFSDDFEAGIVGWTQAGTPEWWNGPPRYGAYSVRLNGTDSIQRTISTVCYQNITVSFMMSASNLDRNNERVRAWWWDGTGWLLLKQIRRGDPEADGGVHDFSYALPALANNSPAFAVRFDVSSDATSYGYVDNVVIQGELMQYTLDLTGVGAGQVRVNGTLHSLPWSGVFDCGTVVDLEAVPDTCYQFDNWTGSLSTTDNPTTITMDANKAVTANFSQAQYALDLTGVGGGSLLVDGVPQTLPWSGIYPCGANVTIEAVADPSWQFDQWSGDATGSANPIIITMDADKAVTATFLRLYTLTLTGVGSGQVRVEGVLQALPWSGSFVDGTVVDLDPVADPGWQFDHWSGDLTGSADPTTITMDADKAVTATFVRVYTLTITGVGSGQVRVEGVLHALPWSGSFVDGTVVDLDPVPDPGWQFDHWSGDLTGSADPTTITMDANKAVTATFVRLYTLTVTGVGSGTVVVDGVPRHTSTLPWTGSFVSGTVVTLAANPDPSWQFLNWSGDLSGNTTPTTITMDADKAVTATFTQQYILSLAKTGNGSVRVNGTLRTLPWSGAFAPGESVDLEAVPDVGWTFHDWTGDANWPGATLTISMTSNKNITANFVPGMILTITGNGSGSVLVDSVLYPLPYTGTFTTGAVVNLQAVPDSGWTFAGWTGDVTWPTAGLAITMSSNRNLVANFQATGGTYTLTLNKTGNGSVRVNSTLHTLPWSGSFVAGTSVTLQAVPDASWYFVNWSGDATGTTNPITVTMDAAKTITANFTEETAQLTLDVIGQGSIKVNGETVTLPYTGEFGYGSSVTLQAVAVHGWRLEKWQGAASGSDNPLEFTVTDDASITAVFFVPDTYYLTITKTGSGTVLVNDVEISTPWTGEFVRGEKVELKARVTGDQEFLEWSGEVNSTDPTVTVLMDGDSEVLAVFTCVASFPDVPCDYWCSREVEAAHACGIVEGFPDELYRPKMIVTRAAMAVFVARAMVGGGNAVPEGPAEPTFTDVPPDYWAYDEIEYAVDNNIVVGYGNNTYQPEWQLTRGQMAVFVSHAIVTPTGEEGLADYVPPERPTFPDTPTTYWSYKHIEYLAENDVVVGYMDGYYRPSSYITRAEMAVYICNAFQLPK